MSHFTVAIITKGKPTQAMIEEALAPYQENNTDDVPRKYLKWNSVQEEYYKDYETGTTTKVRMQDGRLLNTWSEEFRVKGEVGYGTNTHKVPDNLPIVEIPLKQLYPTFREYMEDYCGYKYDEEMQDYGDWENPNAKWDWWQIGGRWAGLLYVPLSCEGVIGEKSWGWGNENPYKSEYRSLSRVDSARIKDLIFPNHQKKYNKAKRFWELYIEGQEPITAEDKELIEWVLYRKEYFINTYKDKETYAESEATFNTYAVIDKDGEWHAKGEMGYWGCSSEEEGQVVNFIKGYKEKVFDNAEDDDWITIVDCHI